MDNLLNFLNPYKWALILAMVIGSFGAGYYVKGKFDKASETKYYTELVETIKSNDIKSRNAISEYQSALDKQTNNYINLTQRAKHVKIYTSNCNITPDGIRLWNDSSEGQPSLLPKDTTGTTERTSTTSTTTVDDLLDNKIKNDEICNGLRLQLEAIIKWDKEAWHDTNSAGNN